MSKNKKVMVFGTFDILHPGHTYLLRKAKKMGDYLTVVLARDETVGKVKGRYPLNKERQRQEKMAKSKLADKVVLGSRRNKYEVIKKYRPDVIVLGYDQRVFVDKLQEKLTEFDLAETKIKRLPAYHPEKYKSSLLRKKLLPKRREKNRK